MSQSPPAKKRKFSHSGAPVKGRQWKAAKHIIAAEKYHLLPPSVATYASIEAPPSTRPAPRLSDLSGLVAPYKDKQTQLYFANVEEFRQVRLVSEELATQYKRLRGVQSLIG
eukprot:c5968_g1_i1.p1 GENE.c5968_g1_i1~~c5968_g1_i1.p1  ORF type:complete len:127 (-),score=20.49 c5968_g1_i1:26-361(-)